METYAILPTFALDGSVAKHWGWRIVGDHGTLEESPPLYAFEPRALLAGAEALFEYTPEVPLIW